jgi:hypothetical protein
LVFVIGHHIGEDQWEQIGRCSGDDPSAALNDWIELIRVDPGEYGIKDTHEDEWARFSWTTREFTAWVASEVRASSSPRLCLGLMPG